MEVAIMLKEIYAQYIVDYVINEPYNKPIFTEMVSLAVADKFNIDFKKAKGITNVNLKRIADAEEVERFQKGIYYKAKMTTFGKKKLNPDLMAIEILIKNGDDIIGYETGPSLFNKIGLTTQVPRNYFIATNLYAKQLKFGKNVVVKKPAVSVGRDNFRYLQALDIIAGLDKIPIDASEPIKIIKNFINENNVDKDKIILTARQHYNDNVLKQTIDIVLGGM